MYNHNKAQQSKNRVHISWDILYMLVKVCVWVGGGGGGGGGLFRKCETWHFIERSEPEFRVYSYQISLGLYSLSDTISYDDISGNLEAARAKLQSKVIV